MRETGSYRPKSMKRDLWQNQLKSRLKATHLLSFTEGMNRQKTQSAWRTLFSLAPGNPLRIMNVKNEGQLQNVKNFINHLSTTFRTDAQVFIHCRSLAYCKFDFE